MSRTLFETPRLRIRHIESTDADAMHAIYGDAEVVRWVDDGEPLTRAQCEESIEVTHRNYAVRGYGMPAALERHSGTVIGFCGLVHPGGQVQAEIKYALRREFWGRGFASEAAAALLAHAASVLGIHHVIATTAPENVAHQP